MSLLSKLSPVLLSGALCSLSCTQEMPRRDFEAYTEEHELQTTATVSGIRIDSADDTSFVIKGKDGLIGVFEHDEQGLLSRRSKFPAQYVHLYHSRSLAGDFDALSPAEKTEYCDMLYRILQEQKRAPLLLITCGENNIQTCTLLDEDGKELLLGRYQYGHPSATPLMYLVDGHYTPLFDTSFVSANSFLTFSLRYFQSLLAMKLILAENNYIVMSDFSTQDVHSLGFRGYGLLQMPKKVSLSNDRSHLVILSKMTIDFPDSIEKDVGGTLEMVHNLISSCIEDPYAVLESSWTSAILGYDAMLKSINMKEKFKGPFRDFRSRLEDLGGY